MTEDKEISEQETKLTIDRLLNQFDENFNSRDLNEFREIYPRYVALYTKFIYRPDIVVRGINPSWFIGREPLTEVDNKEEDKRVSSLRGLHDINAYIDYPEPIYHHYLYSDLGNAAGKEFIKEKVMGWNDCFIQLGGQGGMDEIGENASRIDTKNQNSNCINLLNQYSI